LMWVSVAIDNFLKAPEILDEEKIVNSWSDVGIRSEENGQRSKMWLNEPSETIMLTTQRLIWYVGERGNALTLNEIHSIQFDSSSKNKYSTFLSRKREEDRRQYEIEIFTRRQGRTWLCLESKENATEISELIKEASENALRSQRKTSNAFSASSAGVSGLLRRQRLRQAAAGQLAAETQSELNILIKHAAQVADMLQRYTAKSRTNQADQGIVALGLSVQQDGIWTSATASDGPGLARAIVALAMQRFFNHIFLPDTDSLSINAAAVALPDVYCTFNRARGLHLVSPSDFVNALSVFIDRSSSSFLQDSPLELIIFPSGVKVLRPVASRKQNVFKTLINAAHSQTLGISALDASNILHVPVVLAKQHLLDAEAHTGALCRDDSLSGLRFYPNRFTYFSSFSL